MSLISGQLGNKCDLTHLEPASVEELIDALYATILDIALAFMMLISITTENSIKYKGVRCRLVAHSSHTDYKLTRFLQCYSVY